MDRRISLAPATWAALDLIASGERMPVGDLIRDAVHRELYRRQRAKKADKPDERLIAPLRALLADDFAYASGWDDLLQRLMRKGYRLVESGPGLIIASHQTGAKICKASDLGYSHARLANLLGSPFPVHANGHVIARRAHSWPVAPEPSRLGRDVSPSTSRSPWP